MSARLSVRCGRGLLCWGRIRRWAEDGFLDRLGSLAGDLGELAHPIGAEREQDVDRSSHVADERITVSLDEAPVAQERLDA